MCLKISETSLSSANFNHSSPAQAELVVRPMICSGQASLIFYTNKLNLYYSLNLKIMNNRGLIFKSKHTNLQ
jgi:hypothetical protein